MEHSIAFFMSTGMSTMNFAKCGKIETHERKERACPAMMNMTLNLDSLIQEARVFAEAESNHDEPALYSVTDGKAVGTYLERKFKRYLSERYLYDLGNAALGIDFPGIDVDLKVTSITQPQSSCPFKSARQKIFGLGYHILVFVYEKFDDHVLRTGRLSMRHVIFIQKDKTADYQMTRGISEIIANGGNTDDLVAFFQDRLLPVDEIEARNIAQEVLDQPPDQGFLTISNALQWRLQYSRVIQVAGDTNGIFRLR